MLRYGNIIGEKTRKNKVAIQVEIDTIFGGKCVFMNFGIFKVNVQLPYYKSYGYFTEYLLIIQKIKNFIKENLKIAIILKWKF